jgi:hypothetical protein
MTEGRSQGQLDRAWCLASVNGKARGIGPAITQGAEHGGNEHAELGLQVRILEEKTHDSTHAACARVRFAIASLAPLDTSVNSEAH